MGTNHPEELSLEAGMRSRIRASRTNLFLAVLGFIPLLWLFFRLSWNRPAYQFFPLALVGAGLLAQRAFKQSETKIDAGKRWLTWLLLSVAVLVFLLANYLWSPWLGFIAFLFWLIAVSWGLGGKSMFKTFMPVVLMLLIILPPPLGWDQVLVLWLRSVAVDASSALLDALHVTHVQDGNILLLPGKKLLVEEACSGINSFILCNACCLFWVLWRRRSLWWLLLALPATSLFVVLGNVIRITIGASADYYWHLNLLSGWRHETFGLALLLIYWGLILSVDQLLIFLTRPVRSRRARQAALRRLAAQPPPPPLPVAPWSGSVFGFRFAGIILALLGLGVFTAHLLAGGRHGLAPLPNFSVPARELKLSMPTQLAGWQRINADVGDQTLIETLGVHSTLWHFQRLGSEAVVAVDYPLEGFHNVKVCYVGTGWQVLKEEELFLPQNQEDLHTVRLTLEKSLRYAVVYHSVVDAQGNLLAPPKTLGGRLANSSGPIQTGYRVQLITGGYSPLSSAAMVSAEELFFQARQTLVPQLVEQLRKGPAK